MATAQTVARLALSSVTALALIAFGALVFTPAAGVDGAAEPASFAAAPRPWIDADTSVPPADEALRRRVAADRDDVQAPSF